MKFKYFTLIFFLLSCTNNSFEKSDISTSKISNGFALIYNESDFENKGVFGLGKILNFASFYNQSKLVPFEVVKNRISLPSSIRFRDQPHLLIRLFHHAQFYKLDIHPETFRRMTRAIKSCSVVQLQTEEIKLYFLEVLTAKDSPGRVLRLMSDTGHLGKFLPEFGHIVGMMQFDMYHSYTVDEHTIKAVETLNEIETGKIRKEAPLVCNLIHQTDARRVLYVAIFLHDIAKGRGGDLSLIHISEPTRLLSIW